VSFRDGLPLSRSLVAASCGSLSHPLEQLVEDLADSRISPIEAHATERLGQAGIAIALDT